MLNAVFCILLTALIAASFGTTSASADVLLQPTRVSVLVSTSIVESPSSSQAEGPHQANEQKQQRQQRAVFVTPERVSKFSNQDAVRPTLATNPPGKILEYTPPSYRRSVSTSFVAESPPRAGQQSEQPQLLAPTPESIIANALVGTRSTRSNEAVEEAKCRRRTFARVLRGTRSLLTDGFTNALQRVYSNTGNLLMGSSVLAAIIPIAALALPDQMQQQQQQRRRNGAIAAPLTQTLNINARVESVMSWIERSVDHLPNFPRLHPQECVKRSICEAHNAPNKYGAIGFMLRVMFPAYNISSTDMMDDMEYKVINKYRHAAGYGMNRRSDSNSSSSSACKEKYEDCLVSLLDVAQSMMDMFLK